MPQAAALRSIFDDADEKSLPPSLKASDRILQSVLCKFVGSPWPTPLDQKKKPSKSNIRNWAYCNRNLRRGRSEISASVSVTPASLFTENEALILLFKRPKSDAIPSKSQPQHRRRNPRFPPKIIVDLSPEVFPPSGDSFLLFSKPKAHVTTGNPLPRVAHAWRTVDTCARIFYII